jgi:hypothetical protein
VALAARARIKSRRPKFARFAVVYTLMANGLLKSSLAYKPPYRMFSATGAVSSPNYKHYAAPSGAFLI